MGRSNENIDLTTVEVTSKGSPTKVSKPLLSEKDLERVKSERTKEDRRQTENVGKIEIDYKSKEGVKELLKF